MNPLNMFMKTKRPAIDMLNIIKNINNPEKVLMGYAKNMSPQMQNILQLAKTGNTEELQNVARQMFKEQGRDFDSEFSEFTSQLK